MELFVLKLVALIRPLVSMKYVEGAFELVAIGLFGLLVGVLLVRAAVHGTLRFGAVDAVIVAFTVWCISITLVYFDSARVGEVAKLLIPLLTYIAVKNVVRDGLQYEALLRWVIAGFAVPAVLSAFLIAAGSSIALGYVAYWTELPRWEGMYIGPHNLGHSMTLFVMTLALYAVIKSSNDSWREGPVKNVEVALLALLAVAAVYCLYMSQVRSALLGLAVFASIYLYFYKKSVLFLGAAGLAIVGTVTTPYWLPALIPELVVQSRGMEVTTLDIGSGRPRFWLNDLRIFFGLPLDQKIGGVGIGARGGFGNGEQLIGHNDWLEILTQTGLVGLILFAVLQIVIFRKIIRMPGMERYAFLALFVSVNVMMFVSNSYAWRIQVGHLYYLMLAFAEVRGQAASANTVAGPPAVLAADSEPGIKIGRPLYPSLNGKRVVQAMRTNTTNAAE